MIQEVRRGFTWTFGKSSKPWLWTNTFSRRYNETQTSPSVQCNHQREYRSYLLSRTVGIYFILYLNLSWELQPAALSYWRGLSSSVLLIKRLIYWFSNHKSYSFNININIYRSNSGQRARVNINLNLITFQWPDQHEADCLPSLYPEQERRDEKFLLSNYLEITE